MANQPNQPNQPHQRNQPHQPYRDQWEPTARWRLGRAWRVLAPLLFAGWFLLVVSGKATDLVSGGNRLPLIVAGFVTIALVTAVGSAIGGRRRRNAFQQLAQQRGWRYSATDSAGLAGRWDWAPFGVGSGRHASHVLLGEYGGYPFAAFRYHWTTRSGEDSTRHHISAVALRLPAALPRIRVGPEGVLGGIGRLDIDVESEAFNRRYRVRCDDRRYAVDLLTPRTVEALLSVQPFDWRIDGADLIALGADTVGPAQVLARLEVLAGIARQVPSFVWKDRGRPG
jgi:hypothetical protein